MSGALETLLFVAGFLLILFFCTESFQQGLVRLHSTLQRRPRLKYLAFPLASLLGLGAAALIIRALVHFAAGQFSYD
ncbi:MAG TPA: hypothetical protein VIN67_04685 [Desulfobaccales bacterium]